MSIFKTNITKGFSKPSNVKNMFGYEKKTRKLEIQKQSEDKITNEQG